MAILDKKRQLKKELSLLHIYSIATGATIASGFFLLPGLAFSKAGSSMVFSYLIAVIPIIPALYSNAELSTAMPRAGGVYFFLDRSMGPLMGTIGGLGTWLALALKTSFALVGIGAYLRIFFPNVSILPIAVSFAVLFGLINLFGAKKAGSFQIILVASIIFLLIWFVISGFPKIDITHFYDIVNIEYNSVMATAGLVYVSYVGLSKIASVSEEVKNPEKNLPRAMFLALATVVVVYTIGTIIMIGVIPGQDLAKSLTPVATAAEKISGPVGSVIMTVAAIFAFLSVANVGIMSSSRYPLAMSRDHLMSPVFRSLNKNQIPQNAIYVTVSVIILILLLFDIPKIAKLAGAFQLILFALCSLAVIVMRESKIDSYDPGYRSPLYPWMQIFGIITPFWLIAEMGWLTILFSLGLLVLGTVWYFYYAKDKVIRDGAIYHIFARLGELRFEGLDAELRGILKEKGLREQDPFDAVVASAQIIDINKEINFPDIVDHASKKLSRLLDIEVETLKKGFMDGTHVGATPVSNGAALPHLRLLNIKHSEMVIVRVKKGVFVEINSEISDVHASSEKINAFFFLVSPEDNPGQHLRILAQIASHVDNPKFIRNWLEAENEQDLKEMLLRDDRFTRLILRPDTKAEELIGVMISQLNLPEGCLIALIHRQGEIIVPKGNIQLQKNDRLTIIGYPAGIQELYKKYEITHQ
ncbi:MAG: amino acid permease [Calditrichae bacterium]|nr:amino acid permease [Calditrichota bacterium]MCB9057669.1 amino acid permease [Calditrichia bacterium]